MLDASPLRWVGGKKWLAPKIRAAYEHWAGYGFETLCEPFCGGAIVSLSSTHKAHLNDLSADLTAFWTHVQATGLPLAEEEFENTKENFHIQRDAFNAAIADGTRDSVENAERFYFLNKTCFNGIMRYNTSGFLNTPYGYREKVKFRRHFGDVQEVMLDYKITNQDYKDLEIGSDYFLYIDPPYLGTFSQYNKDRFSLKEHIELLDWCNELPNPMMISNSADEELASMYQDAGFAVFFFKGPRPMGRNSKTEMIAYRGAR